MKMQLSKDTTFTTAKRGRGVPLEQKTFPAGTPYEYFCSASLKGIHHSATIIENGVRYEANKNQIWDERLSLAEITALRNKFNTR